MSVFGADLWVGTSGFQIGVRNVGGASEQQPAAGTVQHMQAGMGSQGLVPVAPTAQAPSPQQLGQTPGYPQHPQANNLHLTGQHMMQVPAESLFGASRWFIEAVVGHGGTPVWLV